MSRSPFGSFFKVATGLQTGPYDYQTDMAESGRLFRLESTIPWLFRGP